jgi:hypothetical protein
MDKLINDIVSKRLISIGKDNRLYFWYSERQNEMPDSICTCDIDGVIKEYSECKSDNSPSNWEDAIFLGRGIIHHVEVINDFEPPFDDHE